MRYQIIHHMTVSELIPVLQMAVGPVVLISGVGLLIGSLTNRLGRVVDRGRVLSVMLRGSSESIPPHTAEQLKILIRRANLLKRAIVFAVLCVLLVAILIIMLFFIAALRIEAVWLIGSLLLLTLGALVVSMFTFLQELTLALKVFHLDIGK
jgi:hypothetical protein